MDKRVIACDLDGTLAEYHGWKGIDHIGSVIKQVRDAIYNAQKEGAEVWIFTARVSLDENEATEIIAEWLIANKINVVGITAIKHKFFTEFWDDRAIQVIKNQGVFVVNPDSIEEVPVTPVFLPDVEEPRTPSSALDVQEGGQHYKRFVIQPVEFAFKNNMPFLDANAFKYICRHRFKNGMQDLRKARHYLELIAEMEYGEKL